MNLNDYFPEPEEIIDADYSTAGAEEEFEPTYPPKKTTRSRRRNKKPTEPKHQEVLADDLVVEGSRFSPMSRFSEASEQLATIRFEQALAIFGAIQALSATKIPVVAPVFAFLGRYEICAGLLIIAYFAKGIPASTVARLFTAHAIVMIVMRFII